ncbi:plastoglobulin-1, chloroplastic-like [Bidens hawaiensis]|uniref:plastoglobulin-1, chloroplastic-like n=1 Tax=Bidens hawaiensis TaxID=980011 RepID=UPI00404B7178
MSLILSHNPSLISVTTTTVTTPISSVSFNFRPRKLKPTSTSIRCSSNKPPSSSGRNPTDQTINDDEESVTTQQPTTVTDEWGEKSEPVNEPLTKLSTSDPPQEIDEWGTGPTDQPTVDFTFTGNGSPVVEDNNNININNNDNKIDELKRGLVDSVYGTGLGFSASAEERAEIMELVTKLDAVNPTPAPTDALDLLDGNWVLLYTAFSELLPLLAVGTTPLLKVDKICQQIFTSTLTIDNSITFSSPVATFTTTASAEFEVRSPSRIQVQFKEGSFEPPKIKSNVSLPENVDIFGQNVSLSTVQQSLNPLQEAVANLAGTISGQSPVKIAIPGERSKSWLLITYLDKDLRISRGDGGLFVLAKEGSPLLDQ